MSVTIRPARLDDASAICEVQCAAIRIICRSCYSTSEIETWTARLLPGKYTDALRKQLIFVAVMGERIVGFSQLDPDGARVKAVYVAPDFAGHGVGQALLQRLEVSARERSICRLSLDATLNAEPFYERAGYRPIGPERHRVSPEVDLACIHMEKTLD